MSIADIVILVIVLLSGIIALRLGLVRVVLGLVGWVGATLATIYGYSYARPFAREWIGSQLIADIAAGAAIFVVSMLVLTFISHSIAGGVRESSFGMLDRTFGLLVGLAIGGIIVSGGYMFSHQVLGMNDASPFYKDARTVALLRWGAGMLASAAPPEWGLASPESPARNTDSTFRTLLSPQPQPQNQGRKRESGYGTTERQEMDRLIRNHQQGR
ncbi:MAG: CvpA family protein [Pseudomonadota bacterium]|nr:hypothetical protein [Rhodospirillaceae bacterium]MEE2722468.1 CvpA family protein [Pseudomonadota bacterium]